MLSFAGYDDVFLDVWVGDVLLELSRFFMKTLVVRSAETLFTNLCGDDDRKNRDI